MRKIRTLIVDDEPLARDGVQTMLAADPEVEVLGQCADGDSAVDFIRKERPDLVFLDIQMPNRDGFEVLSELKPEERPVVIFITAYDRYAIKAFEYYALDYLLKPYRDARFYATLARAKAEIGKSREGDLSQRIDQLIGHVERITGSAQPAPVQPIAPAPVADKLVLKTGSDLNFIKSSDIVWIEAQADFVKVHTIGTAKLVRETLQNMEERLDSTRFLRIHRSTVVNLEHVKKVTPALYGDYTVLMSDGSNLKLSRNNRAKLKQLIGQLNARN